MMVRGFLYACSLWALVLVAPPALAESRDETKRADALFEQAKILLRDGDWARACEKFEQSFALDPSPSVKVKIARCREHEGKLLDALEEYRLARELNRKHAQDPSRAEEIDAVIRADVATLEAGVPKLSLGVSPAEPSGLTLQIDGRHVSAKAVEQPIALDPGEHEIVVRAPGFRDERVRIALRRGEVRRMSVALSRTNAEPVPAAEPPAVASQDGADRGERKGSGQRLAGGLTFGAGVVALGVAGYFGLRTLATVNDSEAYCDKVTGECEQVGLDLLDEASDTQTVGFVFAGIGTALAATGAVLYLSAPTGPDGSARIGVALGPFGGALQGRW